MVYNFDMKRLTKESITEEELEVINSWLDYYECQKIRSCFYGEIIDERYFKKAKILDEMFQKYDSFLDKNEPIYRGIRFKNREEFEIFFDTYQEALNKNGAIVIDLAPSSFSRNKDIAYKEFARVNSDKFYSIIFKLIKRKAGELYIKEFAGKFSYQDEVIIKSQKSKFKIIDIKEVKKYNRIYEIIIEEL